MIRYLYRDRDGNLQSGAEEGLEAALQDEAGFVWLDLREEPVENCERVLNSQFRFHPLAVDDALVEVHVPKLDDWGEYTYIVLHAIRFEGEQDQVIQTRELDLFVGANYIVSYQSRAISSMDRLWEAARRDARLLGRGNAYLLYNIADELVNDMFPVTDELGTRLDQLEDDILLDTQLNAIETILQLKRASFELRRVIMPQREVLNRLSRGDSSSITPEERMYFRDVFDHLVRLQDIVEGLRDLAGSVLEIHLSVVNNRMNEVMKVLTVITTLFMPITFITGFFGMNFFEPVFSSGMWTGQTAFQAAMLLLIIAPAIMLVWMRRRRWM
jgi:magnesium transporter